MLVRCLKGLVHYLRFVKLCKSHSRHFFSTLVFIAMSDTETASIPHASLETSNAGDSAQLSAPSLDTSLSNAETLRLFSQLLDAKFDQKFAAFKCDLEDKEATPQSQLKKLKIESKAANSFTFKGNKVQYELNISLHRKYYF